MKRVSQNYFGPIPVILGLAACLALSACASDELDLATSTPAYGGSARHPIMVGANNKAYVKKCSDWSQDVTNTEANQQLESHGCAVQSNMAAMIVNPHTINHKPKPPVWEAADAVPNNSGNSTSLFGSLFGSK